ncbi:MAG: Hsp20/alpha crystallin family protein [Bacilli bacterium]
MLTNRLFFDDNFFRGEDNIKSDVYEKDGNVVVEMEAPGFTKDDISISIDKGELSVTFEKKDEEEENKKYLHRERKSYSKVTRTFYLGDVSEDKIDASFKNGILVITSPKTKEIETKKTISIKDSE